MEQTVAAMDVSDAASDAKPSEEVLRLRRFHERCVGQEQEALPVRPVGSSAASETLAVTMARVRSETLAVAPPAAEDEPMALQAALLEELVTSIGGIEPVHAAALRSAGVTAQTLLRSTKPEFDAITKGAGLTLGVRLKLRGAINKIVAACSGCG